ncbi:N-(5'-phosphoribosyl)anthranilate isomerase [Brumimicrobium salinarum]|uniref:N-(5'-phosphoribosyl)anthranilate isomerase n=1 Tax=Brumimicrobium salinarum TaxID=2058658 RepID=A0A2I0R6X3_9FLAO|nr:phosphoribosylanthranilate isomerase [Brumimicrobium salinarum]PKR82325.1 N-(5'-phosphoribosyl)anthranilate isomerase [Brumimicrobium salinarum]
MKIKVCGMKKPENIVGIANLRPDFMGFICYEKSPRYIGHNIIKSINALSSEINKVGVFVNASMEEIKDKSAAFGFDYIQLHGNESASFTKKLNEKGYSIIKAFQTSANFDWSSLKTYTPFVDYFLFDTPTKQYGGSGKKFDWAILKNYTEQTPFFLSGGITNNDIDTIKNLSFEQLIGIDINSKYETEPGLKNIDLVKQTIKQIKK